jgi:hypothetical protein
MMGTTVLKCASGGPTVEDLPSHFKVIFVYDSILPPNRRDITLCACGSIKKKNAVNVIIFEFIVHVHSEASIVIGAAPRIVLENHGYKLSPASCLNIFPLSGRRAQI